MSGCDLQGETLGQRGFADTGFADEHGVVFLSAAENLGDAFQLFLATHHGVYLALGGHLGEIFAETVKHRGGSFARVLALPHGAAFVFIVIIVELSGGSHGFGKMQLVTQLVLECLKCDSRLRQQHLDGVLGIQLCGFQDGQDEMVGFHSLASVLFREEVREMQPSLSLHAHGDFFLRIVGTAFGSLKHLLQPGAQPVKVNLKNGEYFFGDTFPRITE